MSVYTRTWQQVFGRPRPGTTIGPVARIIGHTEAGAPLPASATVAQELQRLRAVDAFHRSLGWAGFGYTVMPCASGRIYEGRGYRRSGAHTVGRNHDSYAWMTPGDGDRTPMTPQQIAVIGRWVRERIAAGDIRPNPTVTGHRDHIAPGAKSCPGNLQYPQLAQVRAAITGPTTTPTTHAPPPPPEEDVMASLEEVRQVVREEVRSYRDPIVHQRLNEGVRLSQASCEGAVALHRKALGLPPSPRDDRRWSKRIRDEDDPATLVEAFEALKEKAATEQAG